MSGSKWHKTGDFYRQASASVTAGATDQVIFTEKVKPALTLRITRMATYAAVAAAWGNLLFNPICWNSVPQYPYVGLRDQVGLQNDPVAIEPVELPPGSELTARLGNTSGTAYVGGVVLIGEWGYYE